MQDFGDCIQSFQIGPQRVQPLSASPIATTPPSTTNLRNMYAPTTREQATGRRNWGIFKPGTALAAQCASERSAVRVGARARVGRAAGAHWFDRAAAQITVRNKAEKESIK
ncbi:hypothetical protein [Bradyrhizobium brasilense]|uniref:Uncharacterized protein n=1 Tax=Bradyrhizobium brasilense TaxID=1419277 RepID=A0A1G7PIH1_9BRAD|nr:hypothetical protein [Bradyrhizobium brasilense]MCC8972980.1 hypothetical protein [Bradyrhizobium brasilense]SDF86041.1 hypothetical protein SAMN05216337_10804 [Bradyrhizobium brasilense]